MSQTEQWNDCNWVGIINVKEPNQMKTEPIELWDDYDERLRGESQWKSYET